MPFTSVSTRISTMPLVLVGPILRKITGSSVSVFVVTKESKNVELSVYKADNTPITTATAQTKALGAHVHVLVLTASPPSGSLVPNRVYQYNLKFDGVPMIQPNGTLTDGVLVNAHYQLPEGITYGDHIYPSFLLPADSTNQLKFVHGSCRKPHGGVTDALRGLDTLLATTVSSRTHTVPINERPQFLCLTGDQIYADDVADVVLHIIIDIEQHLFRWGSPDTRESLPTNPPDTALKPGTRQSLVALPNNRVGPDKFTSTGTYAKSHLIRLAEYYGMYLLAWSDVLWPPSSSDFPIFQDVYPGVEETRTTRETIVFNSGNMMETGREIEVPNHQYRLHHRLFTAELPKVLQYRKSLKFVRRALANIPTYMMFDDHEITDDWFLTREWTQNVLNPNGLTKRIVQNGLAAFAVFQAWGNTPERFSSGNGALLLGMLESLNTNGGGNASVFQSIGNLVLPQLNSNATKLQGGFQWHFKVPFDLFDLIVLNTRTQRGYLGDDDPPELIHPSEIPNQVDTSSGKSLAVIVSPAPVFGNWGIERVQELYTKVVALGNPYVKDYEAWVFQDDAFQVLLRRIADFRSSILLSGDVHYGYSSSIEYWKLVNNVRRGSGIAQLCSSSLKNSDSHTESAATNAAVRPRLRNSEHWIRNYERVIRSEEIRYRIYFEVDERAHDQRLAGTAISLSDVNSQYQAGYRHYETFSFDSHRYVVGRDNIGLVKLNDGNSLRHEFWFVMGRESRAAHTVLQPSTVHTVPFGPPTSIPPI